MNKTFTMIVATAALAGLAFANIETPPAGYIEVTSSALACNPFTPFAGSGSLADLDGTNFTGTIRFVDRYGRVTTECQYNKETAQWVEKTSGTSPSESGLSRGAGFQAYFSDGVAGNAIVIAGNLSSENVPLTSADTRVGYNLLGNVSAVAKPLSSFTFTNFDGARDYLVIRNKKYKWNKTKGWYKEEDNTPAGNLMIESGEGFVVYFKQMAKSVTLPGSY